MVNYFSELQNEFPRVYPSYPYCGFYIPDGWKDLIHRLSKELNEYLISNTDVDFVVDQVKSKHSTLRFYYSCSDLNVQTIVEKYENESGNPKLTIRSVNETKLCLQSLQRYSVRLARLSLISFTCIV